MNTYTQCLLYVILCFQLSVLAMTMRSSNDILKEAFLPDAGLEQSISFPVREANALLQKHAITRFSLNEDDYEDIGFRMPMVEYNYPIRFYDRWDFHYGPSFVVIRTSSIWINDAEEKEVTACDLIDQGISVAIYHCEQRKYEHSYY